MNIGIDLFVVTKPVDDGLVDVLYRLATRSPSISEEMKVGDMHISDWSLFDSTEPLIRKQAGELTALSEGLVQAPVRMSDAWFHIYRTGSAFGRHNHLLADRDPATQFSCVYYLQAGDAGDGGQLRIESPEIVLTPRTGTFIVFPAATYHEVMEHRGQSDRVIIGCNFEIRTQG